MGWREVLNTPVTELFKKKLGDEAAAEAAKAGKPADGAVATKEHEPPPGMLATFYRKWKDPAFLKQARILAEHMARDGVDLKNQDQVKAWIEKNKAEIEAGKYSESPAAGGKPQTYEKSGPETGRNQPCPCGSGKKFKKCCANK